jgi:hypothetical protein
MKNLSTTNKTELVNNSSDVILQGIENHKLAAKHYQEAANHHLDAAKHREAGNHEEAWASMVKAHGHSSIAKEASKEDVKNHRIKNWF